MNHLLCDNEWLSNKNNAMKVLVWCIGSSYLATSLANGIHHYILGPVTQETIRRIRNNSIDSESLFPQVPTCLLHLVNSNPMGNSIYYNSSVT